MFDKEVLHKVGYWDESYFMYYEDVDFCERARGKGLKIGIDSEKYILILKPPKTIPKRIIYLQKQTQIFIDLWKFHAESSGIYTDTQDAFEERNLILSVFIRSSFVRNFFSLNASAFINKALHFFLFITMIRFIPLKDYGIYTLAWAHVTILSPLVDFGTTSYGMVYLPREGKERVHSLFTLRFFYH